MLLRVDCSSLQSLRHRPSETQALLPPGGHRLAAASATPITCHQPAEGNALWEDQCQPTQPENISASPHTREQPVPSISPWMPKMCPGRRGCSSLAVHLFVSVWTHLSVHPFLHTHMPQAHWLPLLQRVLSPISRPSSISCPIRGDISSSDEKPQYSTK